MDKASGATVWGAEGIAAPQRAGDFSISHDYLLYAPHTFSQLVLIDKHTGAYYDGDYSAVKQIANPAVYNNGQLYITHTVENEVIGFVVSP